jgi:hypothetical protein
LSDIPSCGLQTSALAASHPTILARRWP